jgi:hypothetical protein
VLPDSASANILRTYNVALVCPCAWRLIRQFSAETPNNATKSAGDGRKLQLSPFVENKCEYGPAEREREEAEGGAEELGMVCKAAEHRSNETSCDFPGKIEIEDWISA